MSETTVTPFLRRELAHLAQLTQQRDYYRALSFAYIRRYGELPDWEIQPEDAVAAALGLLCSTTPTGSQIEGHLRTAIDATTAAHEAFQNLGPAT